MGKLDQLARTYARGLGGDDHWQPKSPEGKAVCDRLTAPENRQAFASGMRAPAKAGLTPVR